MMYADREREARGNQAAGAATLIGIGVLFYLNYWWPGILFVVGASVLVRALITNANWPQYQGGMWLIGIGVWAVFKFNVAILFVVLGCALLLGAIMPKAMLARKPTPPRDNGLE